MPKYTNIYKRKDGRWEGRAVAGRNPATGQTKYKYVYGDTQRECHEALKKLEQEVEKGVIHGNKRLELGTWMDTWLHDYKKNQVQETTYEGYGYSIQHIKRRIGRAYLAEVSTEMIQDMINDMKTEGLTRSVKIVHCMLNAALKQAVRNGMIPYNPAEFVALPKQVKKEAAYLTPDEQRLFIKALEGNRLAPLFMFQLATGLRPGEVRGLKWKDVDFDNAVVTVQRGARRLKGTAQFGPTKNKKPRDVELLDEALDVLLQQKLLQEKDKANMKEGYKDNGLIFANQIGGIMDDGYTRKILREIQETMRVLKATELNVLPDEVPKLKFTPHSLRHTFATRALEKDIPLKIVADWLGHSTVRITGDVYSHAIPAKRRKSMAMMKGILKDE